MMKKIRAIDLFCGAGGLSHGLVKGGIEVVAGIDFDGNCKYPFERNNSPAVFVEADVAAINGADLNRLWGKAEIRLLAGCAPCQPFSNYSQGRDLKKDSRWRMLDHFGRLIDETRPEFVTMENVPQLARNEVFNSFVNKLESLGYAVRHAVLDSSKFGVPQRRQRIVLVASLCSKYIPDFENFARQKRKTVRDAIFRLSAIGQGGVDEKDPLHRSASLSDLNLARIRASEPGGNWKDWPEELRAPCHSKDSGDGYTAVYGRMEWDRPSPTMTTQCFNYGSGRFGHPAQDRSITFREAAILQGFPKAYKFEKPGVRINSRHLGKLIGNAVPPPLGTAIAKTLIGSR